MAEVAVTVNGHTYQVACEDGEEDHVRELSTFLDKRIGQLVASVGQVGEGRLLLMAGLMAADDLAEAYGEIEELRARLEQVEGEGRTASGRLADAAGGVMDEAAGRLEHIAAGLETT